MWVWNLISHSEHDRHMAVDGTAVCTFLWQCYSTTSHVNSKSPLVVLNPDKTKNVQNTGKISFSSSGKFWLPLHLFWLTRKCWTSSGGDLLCRISSKSANKHWNCGQKSAYALQAKYSCHCPNLKKPRLLDNFLYRTPTPNNSTTFCTELLHRITLLSLMIGHKHTHTRAQGQCSYNAF